MTDSHDTSLPPGSDPDWQTPGPRITPPQNTMPPLQNMPPAATAYAPYAAQPYFYPQQPATNGLAVASFILGLTPLLLFFLAPITTILAIIFGHVGLSQVHKRGERGRGFAITGLILGYIGLGITLLFIIFYAIVLGSSLGDNPTPYSTLDT